MLPQTESPYYNRKTVRAVHKNLATIFPLVKMYTCHMPIYPSTYWSFAFCSKKYDPIANFDQARYDKIKPKTNTIAMKSIKRPLCCRNGCGN
jgi:spermidine synthase